MTETPNSNSGLSFKTAALVTGIGLLLMTVSAPPAFFHFLPQGAVEGDPAATVAALRGSGGTPYLIGAFLLFSTYCLDIVVAWGLYWLIRPGKAATAQLVAWTRLVYTALAFVGLMHTFQVYDLANSTDLVAAIGDAALDNEVTARMAAASSISSFALFFFGVHLLVLSGAILKAKSIPTWLAVLIALAGFSYIALHLLRYVAPNASTGWLLILAMGELVFMGWLLFTGLRTRTN